jgi:all-trans-retinol 13,14-reductase
LAQWAFRTLQALLDRHITDPLLRAVLSAQSGNHGLPPSQVSLPVHALMSAHYFDGGWYPAGGAKAIPQAFIKALQALGSRIQVRARVERIVVEHGRAAAVELADGTRIAADHVVCNADPAVLYGQLLPAQSCRRERRKVARTEYSISVVSGFCAVELDLAALGYDSGNYWWYRDADVNGVYERQLRGLPGGPLDALFLSITSLKDPGHLRNGHHTLEMFTFVPWSDFEGMSRGDAYLALKQQLGARMLEAAEHVIPNLRRHVKLFELGTPLTNTFYCNAHRGACYGTAKTPWQVGPFSFGQRGPVEGLHLCGASTLGHGFAAAATSGVLAAQAVLARASAAEAGATSPWQPWLLPA